MNLYVVVCTLTLGIQDWQEESILLYANYCWRPGPCALDSSAACGASEGRYHSPNQPLQEFEHDLRSSHGQTNLQELESMAPEIRFSD